jgi:SAM-dependent methyltransferase
MDYKKPDWKDYFNVVTDKPHREILENAVQQNTSGLKTAIDCGCGVGADAAYLLSQGYEVIAFDKEARAIDICNYRFSKNPGFRASVCLMEEFAFSEAGLVLASNSLFFCQPERFDETIHKMLSNLVSGGIFLGDFVGPEDSWVHSPNHSVHAVTKDTLDVLFCDFDILALHERDELATTALGNMKHWHTFTVLARKN